MFAYNELEVGRARADYKTELYRAATAKSYRVNVDVADAFAEDEDDAEAKAAADKVHKQKRIDDFDKTPLIDDETAAEIERNKTRGKATADEKLRLSKYFYCKQFRREVDGNHYVNVEKHLGKLAQICASDDNLDVVLERDVHKWGSAYAEMADVKFTKLHLIKRIATLLGLKSVLDTETNVTSDRVRSLQDELNGMLPELCSEFNLRRSPDKRVKDLKQIRGLLDSIFGAWCGGKFKNSETRQRRKGRGKRVRDYEYRLGFDVVHEICNADGEVKTKETLLDIAKYTKWAKPQGDPGE